MAAHEVDRQLDERRIEREFVSAHGSANQNERWIAGLLPHDELLALVRAQLFSPFVAFRRWQKIEPNDVRHERGCSGGEIHFFTQKPSHLTHDEWSMFKKITTAVDAANGSGALVRHHVQATIELVEHVGRCNTCSAELFGRAANIRVVWAGRPLSREYNLEAR